ncbi:MAG TPA: gamma-glutamyl-gamma-aminobutyrate hydrolase family protein, partial [Bacteroidales bacterium]|nr:gamma-glutamyl-gamma-aminobutyrate hydrolase family protein [Bacteroidales bacterium]
IAISKASPNYVNWLKRSDPGVVTLDLYKLKVADAVEKLAGCSALLVTGGEDVFPGRYGKITDTSRCTEMNPYRDSLEIALIQAALARKMPVAGVCRGEQIINVALGGTLVIDLPADVGKKVTHQCDDYLHCFHGVRVMAGRLLPAICRVDSGTVTTNHHQAVERLAPGLAAGAFSGDGVVESIEWENPGGKSFLVAVQWHPERMEASNPLSGPLADEFLRQAALYSSKN